MSSYGHAYLTSYGWTGTGTGLRKGAIDKPLAIQPKKNLSGLGKDRDEAFPFWDHLFTAASKAITIRISSDDEDAHDTEDAPSRTDPLRRTTTGIISNRRPLSGTPASTSDSPTPNPDAIADAHLTHTGPADRLSFLATAKREAAKRSLYARFFRGPVLGPDDDPRASTTLDVGPLSSGSLPLSSAPVHEHAGEQDSTAREEKKSKKRESQDGVETREERRARKRLKKQRKAARAAKKAQKALAREKAEEEKSRVHVTDRKDKEKRPEENETSSCPRGAHKQVRISLAGEDLEPAKCTTEELEGELVLTNNRQQDTLVDATDASNIVLTTKKKRKKRKDTPH